MLAVTRPFMDHMGGRGRHSNTEHACPDTPPPGLYVCGYIFVCI